MKPAGFLVLCRLIALDSLDLEHLCLIVKRKALAARASRKMAGRVAQKDRQLVLLTVFGCTVLLAWPRFAEVALTPRHDPARTLPSL